MNHAIVTFTGNLVADPERKQLTEGRCVTKIRVACTERARHKDRDEWYDASNSFFDVVSWGALADRVADCLHKGDAVFVTGKLRQRSYERREGGGRVTYWEVEATDVGPTLRRTSVVVTRQSRSGVAPQPADAMASSEPDPWTSDLGQAAEPAA